MDATRQGCQRIHHRPVGSHIVRSGFCMEDPSHLDRGVEEDSPVPDEIPAEIAAAEAVRKDATHDLSYYRLRPSTKKGVHLLDHMYEHGQRAYKNKPNEYGVSKHLDVAIRTPHQRVLNEVDYRQQIMATIMEDVDAGISRKQAVKTRLNQLGQVGGQSAFINDPETNELQRFRLNLMLSQADAEEQGKREKRQRKKAAQSDLESIFPEALHRYIGGDVGRGLTKVKIEAILSIVFAEIMPAAKNNKPDMLEKLQELASESPYKISEAEEAFPYDPSAPPELPPVAAKSPDAKSTDGESTNGNIGNAWEAGSPASSNMNDFFDAVAPGENGGEEDVPPAISLRRWILTRCAKAVVDIGLKCTSVQLAKLIVELVGEIRIHGKDKYEEMTIPARIGMIILSHVKPGDDNRQLIKEFRDEVEEKMLDFVDDEMMTSDGLDEFM